MSKVGHIFRDDYDYDYSCTVPVQWILRKRLCIEVHMLQGNVDPSSSSMLMTATSSSGRLVDLFDDNAR